MDKGIAVTVALGFSALMGYLTMLVWNTLAVPQGAPVLSFWLAWALWFVVSALLRRLAPKSIPRSDRR